MIRESDCSMTTAGHKIPGEVDSRDECQQICTEDEVKYVLWTKKYLIDVQFSELFHLATTNYKGFLHLWLFHRIRNDPELKTQVKQGHGYTYFTWNTRKECFCFTSGEKECLTQVYGCMIKLCLITHCALNDDKCDDDLTDNQILRDIFLCRSLPRASQRWQ